MASLRLSERRLASQGGADTAMATQLGTTWGRSRSRRYCSLPSRRSCSLGRAACRFAESTCGDQSFDSIPTSGVRPHAHGTRGAACGWLPRSVDTTLGCKVSTMPWGGHGGLPEPCGAVHVGVAVPTTRLTRLCLGTARAAEVLHCGLHATPT